MRCLTFLLWLMTGPGFTQDRSIYPAAILPPPLPWQGASERLQLAPDDPWVTPAERTNLTETPDYQETLEWLQRLTAAAPQLSLTEIGKSAQGRTSWMVTRALGLSGFYQRSPYYDEQYQRYPVTRSVQ